MKKFLLGLFIVLMATIFVTGSALAVSYTFPDTISNFPDFPISPVESIGTPHVGDMTVTVDDAGILQTVSIDIAYRRTWDTLFINTDYTKFEKWHEWDYMVRDTLGTSDDDGAGSTIAGGLYTVSSIFTPDDYTLAPAGRKGHPDGIKEYNDNGDQLLSMMDASFAPTTVGNPEGGGGSIVYDFSSKGIYVGETFLIAYTPWCSNDVSSGTPVPEPATMLLGGLGLLGMGLYMRRRSKRA